MYAASELLLFGRVPYTLAAVRKANVCGALRFGRCPQTLAAVLKANVYGSLLFRRFPYKLTVALKASVCGSLLFGRSGGALGHSGSRKSSVICFFLGHLV